jgi:hypothetical protein
VARPRKSKALAPLPDPLPWEKQRGEGAKAFAAFALYRDLRTQRSLVKVERTLHETGVPAHRATIAGWSSRWRWVERADAWDREEDRIQREEHARTVGEARRAEAMAGTLMLGAAIRRLTGDENTRENEAVIIQPLDLNQMDAGEVARLADVGAKLVKSGLGITADLTGATSVSGQAVYDLARAMLMLTVDSLDSMARAAVGANGNLDELIALHQNRLVEEAGTLYTRTMRS